MCVDMCVPIHTHTQQSRKNWFVFSKVCYPRACNNFEYKTSLALEASKVNDAARRCVLHLSVNVDTDEGYKVQPGPGFQELNARRHFYSLIHSHVHGSLEWGAKMTWGIS